VAPDSRKHSSREDVCAGQRVVVALGTRNVRVTCPLSGPPLLAGPLEAVVGGGPGAVVLAARGREAAELAGFGAVEPPQPESTAASAAIAPSRSVAMHATSFLIVPSRVESG
jgi:hypothetical protein